MMKKLIDIFIIIYVGLVCFVLIGGFWQKKHAKPTSMTQQSQPQQETAQPETTVPTPQSSITSFSTREVAPHNNAANCWIVIENKVYDVSPFLREHPGGISMVMPYCGKDATEAFNSKGGTGGKHTSTAQQLKDSYFIGNLQN
jgi:cytochrome b involved in lipid metabolism